LIKKTLEAIFRLKPDTRWSDIITLLKSYGAEVSEGKGSRVRVYLNGRRAVFHRPHPGNKTQRGTLRAVKDFLIDSGTIHYNE
jgi:hypothetical protein